MESKRLSFSFTADSLLCPSEKYPHSLTVTWKRMKVGEEDDKDGCEKWVYQSTSTKAIINHQPCYFLSGDYLGKEGVRWKRWKLIVQHRGGCTGIARWCCPEREIEVTFAVPFLGYKKKDIIRGNYKYKGWSKIKGAKEEEIILIFDISMLDQKLCFGGF